MASSYTGYDIVLVAGQSNACGNSITVDDANQGNDATGGLPIYVLRAGSDLNYYTDRGYFTAWNGTPQVSTGKPKFYYWQGGGGNHFFCPFRYSYQYSCAPSNRLLASRT